MTIENHILEGIQFKQTPNISGLKIVGPRFLILHYTASGNVPGTVGSLTRKGGNKSAHLVIGRDGEVVQLASFDQRAWHCGQSEWKGLEGLNYYSIGIEFVNWGDLTEDKDGVFRSWAGTIVPSHEVVNAIHKNETIPRDWQDFTPAQLAKGAEVARAILEAYPSIEMILGHDDIAPTRKTDPGPAFPMNQFLIDCRFMDAPEPTPPTPTPTDFDEAVNLLRVLADLQNGPPLETYRKDWEETMEQTFSFLAKWENHGWKIIN